MANEQQTNPVAPLAGMTRQIAVPTTLISGRHDRATPLRVGEEASGRYGWPLSVIEKAADDPTVDQPEAFLHALRSALHREDE
jgi:pimeloyl-ACP methyl ester carboxylesterase